MRYLIKHLFILCLAFFCMVNLQAQKLNHVLGEVLVEVRNDNSLKNLMKDLSSDSRFRSSLKAKQIMTQPMNLWVVQIDPNEVNEIKFLNKVIGNNHVLLAQQNHISQLRAIPDDPNFTNQWQYINTGQSGGVVGADLDMDLAWDLTTGGITVDGDTIVACVIDDGINLNHPDFGDNIWINKKEIAGNNIDDDGNGYIDDVRGWNAYQDNDDVTIDGSHGTSVAGIVGAQGNNGIGVAGVNWNVKMMIVRGGSPEATALASYAYPYTMRKLYNETNGQEGAFVVCTNASWGVDFGSPEDAPIWCEFYNMLGEVGILNFGATINGNTNVDVEGDLPTSCESNYLVSVTNVNRQDEKVNGAGYGKRSIDIGAFGEQAYTTSYNSYSGFGGTSGATPHVAGTAALLYSADCPDFISLAKSNPSQAAMVVKDCILHGIDPNTSLTDITTTGGRLNTYKSLQNLISTCGDCSQAFGGDINGLTDKTGTLTWYDNDNIGNTSIRYKMLEGIDWIVVENVESGYQFEDLNACSTYEFQTKTECPGNPDSEYTYSRVFDTDGCCEMPAGITITVVDQLATVQWDDVLATTNFVVEWRNVQSNDWISEDLGVDNTFVLGGILDCEFYEVRVKSQCAATDNESEFSAIFNINGDCDGCTKDFCSFSEKDVSDEFIDAVEIENVFLNQSGLNPNGYGNYLGQFEINLMKEEIYNINLTPGYNGQPFDEHFSAYIDFDQNGTFEEEENIFRSLQSTQVATTGIFSVPADAVSGVTRMRVIMRFNELNGPCDELGFEYGEVEEYCVTISGDMECPTTFEVAVTDNSLSSLTFEILENSAVEFYLISYREEDGPPDFNVVQSPSNVIVVNGLEDCTLYEFKSGYKCDGVTLFDTETQTTGTMCDPLNTDNIEDLSLNIYPNPSFDNLVINFDSPAISDLKLELISNEGKTILTKNIINNRESKIIIEGSSIPAGVYFLKVSSNERVSVEKWVKY